MANSPNYFISFTGSDGLLLPLTMPRQTSLFDYTVMFWFKSAKSLAELQTDDSILNQKAFLFELPGSVGCYVSRINQEGPFLQCVPVGDNSNDGGDLKIDLAKLNDI